jgi:hypothetical protein
MYGWTYTPTKPATCNLTVSTRVLTNEGAPAVRVAPALRYNGVGVTLSAEEADLHDAPYFTKGFTDPLHNLRQQGAHTSGFNVLPGVTYEFGLKIMPAGALLPLTKTWATLTWYCQEDDSNPGVPANR